MHRFHAAFGGGLCTAHRDRLAGAQCLHRAGHTLPLGQRIAACENGVGAQGFRHSGGVLQLPLSTLHAALCGALHRRLQRGQLPLPVGKLAVSAL